MCCTLQEWKSLCGGFRRYVGVLTLTLSLLAWIEIRVAGHLGDSSWGSQTGATLSFTYEGGTAGTSLDIGQIYKNEIHHYGSWTLTFRKDWDVLRHSEAGLANCLLDHLRM
ncbi:uncharacterized protein LOC141591958 isoform X2 [Silene latifolia]|uniref:uncharacterized protein LOC141591958 isoform X2 n=1 Tax=Silene latifolia TaxID=37657 RepID=UPI003D77DD53